MDLYCFLSWCIWLMKIHWRVRSFDGIGFNIHRILRLYVWSQNSRIWKDCMRYIKLLSQMTLINRFGLILKIIIFSLFTCKFKAALLHEINLWAIPGKESKLLGRNKKLVASLHKIHHIAANRMLLFSWRNFRKTSSLRSEKYCSIASAASGLLLQIIE